MSKGFLFGNESLDEEFNDELNELDEQYFCSEDDNIEFCIVDDDFCQPSDNRIWTSNVEDIDDGDNFADYCIEFFEMLEEEEYYDN